MVKGPVDQNAMKALNQMKYEIANELGITGDLSNNKDSLSAGKNAFFGGYVGGHMTKKLVEIAEKQLVNKK